MLIKFHAAKRLEKHEALFACLFYGVLFKFSLMFFIGKLDCFLEGKSLEIYHNEKVENHVQSLFIFQFPLALKITSLMTGFEGLFTRSILSILVSSYRQKILFSSTSIYVFHIEKRAA